MSAPVFPQAIDHHSPRLALPTFFSTCDKGSNCPISHPKKKKKPGSIDTFPVTALCPANYSTSTSYHPSPTAKLPSSRGAGNMSYFFATPVDIDVVLEDADDRSMVDVKLDKNRREKAPLYMDGESVKGAVTVRPKDGKRLEHTGIKVQFIGTIGKDF